MSELTLSGSLLWRPSWWPPCGCGSSYQEHDFKVILKTNWVLLTSFIDHTQLFGDLFKYSVSLGKINISSLLLRRGSIWSQMSPQTYWILYCQGSSCSLYIWSNNFLNYRVHLCGEGFSDEMSYPRDMLSKSKRATVRNYWELLSLGYFSHLLAILLLKKT